VAQVFPQGFLQYFQARPEGVEVVLWFTEDYNDTITAPQSFKPIPPPQFQDSFFINDTSFFNKWELANNGTICPTEQQSWKIPADNSCNTTSPNKFHVPCGGKGSITDEYGNQLLEVMANVFPILELSSLSFVYATIKPQCQRVLHWHPSEGELALVLKGSAQVGLVGFPTDETPNPIKSFFNVTVGDIWFFPTGYLQYITNAAAKGGEDFIAILGFSENSLRTITSAGGLQPIPKDLQKLSLGLTGNAFELLSETQAPFTCLGYTENDNKNENTQTNEQGDNHRLHSQRRIVN